MKTSPVLLFFDPTSCHSAGGKPHRHATALQAGGFTVRSCTQAACLHTLALSPQYARRGSVLIVLGGSHSENCAAAMYLRGRRSQAGVVALVHAYREAQLLQAMQCGVDAFCLHGASAQFVMALLCQLMSRITPAGIAVVPAGPQGGQHYSLLEEDWMLSGPGGYRVGLTTSERAFLVALFKAGGRRATHGQLALAVAEALVVGSANGAGVPDASTVRLALLVSRLRRKCNDSGLPLPIKSVHNWGYMFAA